MQHDDHIPVKCRQPTYNPPASSLHNDIPLAYPPDSTGISPFRMIVFPGHLLLSVSESSFIPRFPSL